MQIPEGFLKTEVRCGFEVPAMMKRAWAASVEVLQVVGEICEKYHLQYFADWGTLLGAIRHKGFIPWDDDIDICMKRKDYNRLIQVLPQELPHGFVVAGMYAESERLQNAAFVPQLRIIADETMWDFNDYMKRFHGFPYQRIGIDIFPLDHLPEDIETVALQRIMIRQGIMILRDWDQLEESGELEGYLQGYEEFCKVNIPRRQDAKNWMWRLIDQISSLYEEADAEEISYYSANLDSKMYRVRNEWYDRAVYMPFEYIQIPVPEAYEDVLRVQFGDWKTPKRVIGGHGYPFYGTMEKELEKQIRAVGFMGDVDEFCEKVSSGELRV